MKTTQQCGDAAQRGEATGDDAHPQGGVDPPQLQCVAGKVLGVRDHVVRIEEFRAAHRALEELNRPKDPAVAELLRAFEPAGWFARLRDTFKEPNPDAITFSAACSTCC